MRDCIYRKIRDSQLMKFDIPRYESFRESDPEKTYAYLMDVIERCVERQLIQDKYQSERERAVHDSGD